MGREERKEERRIIVREKESRAERRTEGEEKEEQ